jgi:large subunit ribosomal protein L15
VKLGVVRSKRIPVKILGSGDVKAKLSVAAHAFSASAVQKIQAAGGTTQTISSTSKE